MNIFINRKYLVPFTLLISYVTFMFVIANDLNIYRFFIGGDFIWGGSRGWHLFVNYFDYGFIKRGLIGTFFDLANFSNLIGNEYILIKASTFISALIMMLVAMLFLQRHDLIKNNKPLVGLLLFSPATIHYFAWDGNLDNYLLIIFMATFLFMRNIWLQAFFIFIGLLIHESFAFFIPVIYFLNLVKHNGDFIKFLYVTAPMTLSTIITISLLLGFGETSMNMNDYFVSMSIKMPQIYNEIELRGALESDLWWSGFNEISYSVSAYRGEALPVQKLFLNAFYVFPATVICLIFPLLCSIYLRRGIVYKILLFAALTFPILMILLANDYYRYTSFVMFLSIVFLFKGYQENFINKVPDKYLICLLPICFLGPYGGSSLTMPFFILSQYFEKFMELI